jgi:hypothetical protein
MIGFLALWLIMSIPALLFILILIKGGKIND